MVEKKIFLLGAMIGIVCMACCTADAAPPWTDLISLSNVEANPEKSYVLTDGNGPWLIYVSSFSGEGADAQAKELVLELRKRYKVAAYIYEGRFDPGEAQGRGVDEYGRQRKWKYQKYKDSKDSEKARHPELREYGVLIGDYESADSPDAQKILQKMKYAKPECLEVKDGEQTNQTLNGWRMIQRQVQEAIGSEKSKLGPMSHAFVTRNPLLPADFFTAQQGLDPFVLDMNKDAEYSLLDCPGKYTVQVATFKGQVVIKQNEIQAIENGEQEMKSGLLDAADKAHRLAQALRMKGYEAYEFHDRYASIVTIGSFNSMGTPLPDGRTEINPEIHKIMKTFAAEPKNVPGQATPVTPLKSLVGIPFDIQPIPVQVPKRSVSMTMRRTATE